MNATSYYVTTCRLIIQADPANKDTWQDIFRILPMLRNSLSCTVCEKLVDDPYTPDETSCQHHVCKVCRGGIKSLRPSCSWCKDYTKYSENPQLKILLENYRKLCSYLKVTQLYNLLVSNKEYGQDVMDMIKESEGGGPQTLLSPGNTSRCKTSKSNNSSGTQVSTSSSNVRQDDGMSKNTAENETGSVEKKDDNDRLETDDDTSQIALRLSSPQQITTRRLRSERISSTGGRLSSSVSSENEPTPTKSDTPPSSVVKDEMFTSPNVKMKFEEKKVDEEISFRICHDSVNTTLFPDTNTPDSSIPDIKTPDTSTPDTNVPDTSIPVTSTPVKNELAKDVFVSRSDTPSPPNSSKYSELNCRGKNSPKIKSYILKPRQVYSGNNSLPKSEEHSSSMGQSVSREKCVVLSRSESDTSLTTTSVISRKRLEENCWLRSPLIEDEGVDPLAVNETVKGSKKNDEKSGCRCGNATSSPGKLTCCGQRCPCYVNRSACLACKCKGCNNPNLPGGGKLLPYLDVAINTKAYSQSATRLRSVSRGVVMPGGSKSSVETRASNLVQIPSGTNQNDSVTDIDINTIPVVNLSSPNAVRTFLGSSAVVPRFLHPKTRNSETSVSQPASSLSSVSIPISSISSRGGLKLRPMHQMQAKELRGSRVIPTIKLNRVSPYSRSVNGHVLQTVSLVTLLKNQKNIQVVRTEGDNAKNTSTLS